MADEVEDCGFRFLHRTLWISVGRAGDNQQALRIVRVDALGDTVPCADSVPFDVHPKPQEVHP